VSKLKTIHIPAFPRLKPMFGVQAVIDDIIYEECLRYPDQGMLPDHTEYFKTCILN
jgi:hypothetical protein